MPGETLTDNPLDVDQPKSEDGVAITDNADKKDAPSEEDKAQKKEAFLLNFPDRETAERSFKEEQAKITKVSMENAALRGKLEVLERMKAPDYEEATSERQKKRDEEIIRHLEEGGSSAVLETIREGLLDVVDLNKKELQALKDEVLKLIEERDPELAQNKEEIDKLKEEYGLTHDKAIKLFRNMHPEQSDKPNQKRAKIPGRTTVTQMGDAATATPMQLPPGIENFFAESGLDSDSVKRIRLSILNSLAEKKG